VSRNNPHLEVGYVSRAHGLAGEVGIRTFDPASEALADVERVLVRGKDGAVVELVIDSVRSTPKEVLVGFEGVESRTAAEKLVGSTVLVYREDLDAPEDGEFFQGDLVGLVAVDESGAELGTVEEIWQTGPVPNLVIRAEGKPELVVPFADEFVPSVDMEQGRIVIRPPEYTE
jgi:16S rRNA processing protein RimM